MKNLYIVTCFGKLAICSDLHKSLKNENMNVEKCWFLCIVIRIIDKLKVDKKARIPSREKVLQIKLSKQKRVRTPGREVNLLLL